jgi:peptide chain release factor 1
MFAKLGHLEKRHEEVNRLLADPEVTANPKRLRDLAREHSDLDEVIKKYREYKSVAKSLADDRQLLNETKDRELREMAQAELEELEPKLQRLEEELKLLLVPKDPNDAKNVIVEIRAGAGGDEAGLFAGDLFRMYSRFAERQAWQVE